MVISSDRKTEDRKTKKCIYFGYAKDFWHHAIFREFMNQTDYIEKVLENNSKLLASAIPAIYYSHEHSSIIMYEKEQTFQPKLTRARVTLIGKESAIKDLEKLIRKEAEKHN